MRVLIVVDMLNDFVDERGALYCGPPARAIIDFVAQKIAEFRGRKEPIIYLKDAHVPDDREFEAFPPHCLKGSWGGEIIAELTPAPEDIIVEKTRFSGFFRTPLEEILKSLGARELHFVGVCTNICVMDTVGDARNRDYPVVVYRDGVADFDQEAHEFALRRMERIYRAKVV
ncbi:cysteine hydrolase family protein [Thermosulfuriphilus sp.]